MEARNRAWIVAALDRPSSPNYISVSPHPSLHAWRDLKRFSNAFLSFPFYACYDRQRPAFAIVSHQGLLSWPGFTIRYPIRLSWTRDRTWTMPRSQASFFSFYTRLGFRPGFRLSAEHPSSGSGACGHLIPGTEIMEHILTNRREVYRRRKQEKSGLHLSFIRVVICLGDGLGIYGPNIEHS